VRRHHRRRDGAHPAGQFGQAGAKSVELAFRDLNEAGGPGGCKLIPEIRDAQSLGAVAVDAAKQLVEIKRVPAIIGGIISPVSIPILTSVTAPSGIVQISPASSSPTLTTLGREGKSGGWFFRTITTDALQGVAAARYALDSGLRKLTVIHVNNDFGVNMVREFSRAYGALGGQIISVTPYNPGQASYQPEVTRALAGNPDALYLVSYPGDGTTIARTWISQGGVKKFLLNDGMNSAKFIADVGPQHLNDAFGTSSGTTRTPSTEYFAREYPPFSKFDASAPADRSYDAAAILGLAVAQAGRAGAGHPRCHSQVLDPRGTVIHAGAAEFGKAFGLIKEGKPIRYVGVIGPVQFDRYGDITGPFRLWRIQNGQVATVGEMSVVEVDQLKALGDWDAGRAGGRRRSRARARPVSTGTPWEAVAATPGRCASGARSRVRHHREGPTAPWCGRPAAQARFILDRISGAKELGPGFGRRAHARLRTPPRGLGSGRARARRAVRPHPAGQHAGPGPARRRRPPGGDPSARR
jgi:branched-chain amino acid transport system substrate-binding protein